MAGAPVRRAPYKDTLQPALHRRFSSTAILLLAVSYLEALLMANWSSYFWSWFPIGSAGFRTILIFSCGLSILILRIAHYHVGLKTTAPGSQVTKSSLFSLQTYETAFWYSISSFLFCPIFLFALSASSNLQWIIYFSGSRARLNERPLFLACYLGACAIYQTAFHYWVDVDRLDLDIFKRYTKAQQTTLAVLPRSVQIVLLQLPGVFWGCAQRAAISLLLCLVVYYAALRSLAWGWALAFLRPFYSLPKTNLVPSIWPTDIYLLVRCIYAGTMLNFIWAAGNAAFSVFMVREPLKNGNPLTSEAKDPNGSLLNGLKSKKLSIKSFAMWELALIAQDFETRRLAIFGDIDRKDGPMWSQVYAICMELMKQIETRVDDYGNPPQSVVTKPNQIVGAKQRTAAPLRQETIFTKTGEPAGLLGGVEKVLDQIARTPGSSPVSELSPMAKKTWNDAKDRVLTKEQQEALSPEHLRSEFGNWATSLMKNRYIGRLFHHDFHNRFVSVVLGTPYAEPTLYVNAAQALCLLAVHSLAEDQFGNVHRDVPSIIRTLTAVIRKVELLRQRIPLHWADPSGTKESQEVDQILDALRGGLEQVVAKFEPYSGDLRLSPGDLRLAKEAVVKPAGGAAAIEEKQPVTKANIFDERKIEATRQRRESKRVDMKQNARRLGRHLDETTAMQYRRLFFRFLYGSIYLLLFLVLLGLLLITPGDAIERSLSNGQNYNVLIVTISYVVTVVIVVFVYVLRLYTTKTAIAGIPKTWVPIEKGDVKDVVYRMIHGGLNRSAAIALAARPREQTDLDGEPGESHGSEARARVVGGMKKTKAVAEDVDLLLPPKRPVWGEIEHNGWASPNSPDLRNLQYSSVILELPNLIEAKALMMAPAEEQAMGADAPMIDGEAVGLLQRTANMTMREYMDRLATLGMLAMDETASQFVVQYEFARFSNRPISNAQFRELMHLFAELLRGLQPLDLNVLNSVEDASYGWGPSESDIDNDAPLDTNPPSPRSSISRAGTTSTRGSVRRIPLRSPSAQAWSFRSAPKTSGSSDSGSVIRLATREDDDARLPYVLNPGASGE
ncbi:hypothetical protein ED733_008277 [Metarhizium rileyi]|uniref:Uncharacterized protein n=1 Tax=Metarhizium rileyi (strain RCEF 4871) TaxID=1649241 RepID=A0A5C6GPX3_METRR|nr:hypothetical protein ED733_008277 [Metarhizium rileyi]